MRNSLAREFANEARRLPRMSKLERENRQNRLATQIMKMLTNGVTVDVCGVKIENVSFTKDGLHVWLADKTSLTVKIKLVEV